mmetsp:Transcript_1234/g.2787  ORF Transcript_1234/g.2787 Transcript_1234/m.2787 type:complete len:259 (-) Transcript_1234:136-912(-)
MVANSFKKPDGVEAVVCANMGRVLANIPIVRQDEAKPWAGNMRGRPLDLLLAVTDAGDVQLAHVAHVLCSCAEAHADVNHLHAWAALQLAEDQIPFVDLGLVEVLSALPIRACICHRRAQHRLIEIISGIVVRLRNAHGEVACLHVGQVACEVSRELRQSEDVLEYREAILDSPARTERRTVQKCDEEGEQFQLDLPTHVALTNAHVLLDDDVEPKRVINHFDMIPNGIRDATSCEKMLDNRLSMGRLLRDVLGNPNN